VSAEQDALLNHIFTAR